MSRPGDVITEAVSGNDGEAYCGDLYRRGQRVIFVYDDMNQEEWSARFDCVVPKTVTKVYPDLLAFTKDWQITAQIPYR